ncbi:MAG TPA: hypothetical protein VEH84_04730 [Alphaproteobacteria bacterium]|nr:hypothetical protein [Alphaproteobacteria bacterium]
MGRPRKPKTDERQLALDLVRDLPMTVQEWRNLLGLARRHGWQPKRLSHAYDTAPPEGDDRAAFHAALAAALPDLEDRRMRRLVRDVITG